MIILALWLATMVIAVPGDGVADGGKNHAPASTAINSPAVGAMTPGMRMGRLMMPTMNPANGKKLFIAKGCVACHAVNGVGGHDAPPMDSHTMDQMMNPFEFAAKMWNHAQGMIFAQQEAFGEQIMFTGQELADIVAFVHSDRMQHAMTESDLTPQALKMMKHGHGEMMAPDAHAKEIGHKHGASDGHGDGHGPSAMPGGQMMGGPKKAH